MAENEYDELVPDKQARRELGNITPMCAWRWEKNTSMNFPKRVKIGTRNFRLRSEIERFKQDMIRRAAGTRSAA